jgi:hypothetical protein
MFNRKRNCQNPDCRELFDPIHPAANCCKKSCNNRLTYLVRKGKKCGLQNPVELRNYCIIHSLLDQRRVNQTVDELVKAGVNFSVFPPAVPMAKGDVPSVLRVGDLGLLLIDEQKKMFKIVQQAK